MTPRMLAAWLGFAEARRRREAAEQLHIGTLAARGHHREVSKTIKNFLKE